MSEFLVKEQDLQLIHWNLINREASESTVKTWYKEEKTGNKLSKERMCANLGTFIPLH